MLPQCLRQGAQKVFLLIFISSLSAEPTSSYNQSGTDAGWSRWIEQVRQKALEYSETLPDFVCAQTTRRYSAIAETGSWKSEDIWEAELSFYQKTERYSNIRLNGKAIRRPMESMGGALSIGEFGSLLRTLFLHETRAEFWKETEEVFQQTPSIVVGFKVPRETSRWALSFKNSHSLNVAYRGTIWIDASNHQVLRITQRAQDLPARFPIAYSEATTVYGYVAVTGLDGTRFLLPQSASVILHERERSVRSLNVMEFRDYRKFTADVRLVPE